MNAITLANELDLRRKLLIGKEYESGGRAMLLYGYSADMLREQQAEIESLKDKIISYENLGSMMINELLQKASEK
jgi:hypothetical protein